MKTAEALTRVVEPLCAATERALAPLPEDYSAIVAISDSLDEFWVEVVAGLRRLRSGETVMSFQQQDVHEIRGSSYYFRAAISESALDVFDRIPECRAPKRGRGRRNARLCAVTDYTALILYHAFEDRILFVDDDARDAFRFLITRFFSQAEAAKVAANFKVNGAEPSFEGIPYADRVDLPMEPYQRAAIRCALMSDGYAWFMDRGTGKTATTIQHVCTIARINSQERREAGEKPRQTFNLIVVPPQTRTNWELEFRRFASAPGRVTVARGTKFQRMEALASAIVVPEGESSLFCAVIISPDSLANSVELYEKVPWDLIAVDESHGFKDPRTNRWKTMLRLRDRAKRRLILTGTPIGNSPADLWSQLEFLGAGQSGFSTFKGFRRFIGYVPVENDEGFGVEKLEKLQNVPLIQERLSRLSFAVTKKEAGLNLPDKLYEIVEVEMTPRQSEIYQQVARALAVEIENKLTGHVDTMTINNILVSMLRLSQVTCGHVTWDAIYNEEGECVVERRVEQLDPNPKIEALVRMLRDPELDPLCKTIVWSNWKPTIRAISARLAEESIGHGCYYGDVGERERDRNVRAFNGNDDFKVLIANPASAGAGLDLLGYDRENPAASDCYCGLEVFVSNNWSSIGRDQAEDRPHRRGTRRDVTIRDLVVPNSIDTDILGRLRAKQEMASTLSDLRGVFESVLKDFM